MTVCFDLETVRQYENWKSCPDAVKAAWQYVAKSKFPDRDYAEMYIERAGLFPEFGKIVVISAMDSKSKEVTSFTGMEFGGAAAEVTLIKNFIEKLTGEWKGKLLGHYIKGFDIPYLVTRIVANGLKIPNVLKLYGVKPWEMSNIIDTREIWKQGQYQTCHAASLVAVCLALGVESPKADIDGSEVSDAYYRGELDRIVKYCENDVRANTEVFNRMWKLGMY